MEAINARPDSNGSAGLPRRPKGLLPSTWLGRTLRISYVDCYGSGQEASGTLLDLYPAGPILSIAGSKVLLMWERLVECELVD